MTTSTFVRRYVNSLKERQIFETFDVLSNGSRHNVDTVLKEMVKKGRIVRLARGIYMRGDETTPLPTFEELAAFKAKSLGSVLSLTEEGELKHATLLNRAQKSGELQFLVSGTGSTFRYGEVKIVLKKVSQKKLRKAERERVAQRRPLFPT